MAKEQALVEQYVALCSQVKPDAVSALARVLDDELGRGVVVETGVPATDEFRGIREYLDEHPQLRAVVIPPEATSGVSFVVGLLEEDIDRTRESVVIWLRDQSVEERRVLELIQSVVPGAATRCIR